MVLGAFGVKLFPDRDYLLNEKGRLVSYCSEANSFNTRQPITNVYFYIYDSDICQEMEDVNYVVNVIELSDIPIYRGNNPKFSLYGDDYDIQKLIDESSVCIYYYDKEDMSNYHDRDKLKFFIHFLYKENTYEIELSSKTLGLLKYTWFITQKLTLEDIETHMRSAYTYVLSTDVSRIVKELKIIQEVQFFYGKDSESSQNLEGWVIDTDDYYILNSLLDIEGQTYPRPVLDNIRHIYYQPSIDQYDSFYKESVLLKAKGAFLKKVIEIKSHGFDNKGSIKYIMLLRYLFNNYFRRSIRLENPSAEYYDTDKTNKIISIFIDNYSVDKHLSAFFYVISESLVVPEDIMRKIMSTYLTWHVENLIDSNLHHIMIYWSSREICEEFNKRSCERFNFDLDFKIFE